MITRTSIHTGGNCIGFDELSLKTSQEGRHSHSDNHRNARFLDALALAERIDVDEVTGIWWVTATPNPPYLLTGS